MKIVIIIVYNWQMATSWSCMCVSFVCLFVCLSVRARLFVCLFICSSLQHNVTVFCYTVVFRLTVFYATDFAVHENDLFMCFCEFYLIIRKTSLLRLCLFICLSVYLSSVQQF